MDERMEEIRAGIERVRGQPMTSMFRQAMRDLEYLLRKIEDMEDLITEEGDPDYHRSPDGPWGPSD
jgi:hypothetical protein